MIRTGIAVVAYNSEREVGVCLDAILPLGIPVLVIDNASSDRTRDEVRKRGAARLIANPWNRGFAGAVNQAFEVLSDCECVLLLNPDAVPEGRIDALEEALRTANGAAAGGKLIGSDGSPQAGFCVRRFPTAAVLAFEALGLNRVWPSNPVNVRYRCLRFDYSSPSEVEQPAGAFLMIRRAAWRALGGFDERFFPLWFEDVDFLKRARAAGYSVSYVPAAAARHSGGHSLTALPWESRQLYWYDSLLKYAAKHLTLLQRRELCLTVILALFARTLFGVFSSRSIRPLFVYGRAARLAGSYLR